MGPIRAAYWLALLFKHWIFGCSQKTIFDFNTKDPKYYDSMCCKCGRKFRTVRELGKLDFELLPMEIEEKIERARELEKIRKENPYSFASTVCSCPASWNWRYRE